MQVFRKAYQLLSNCLCESHPPVGQGCIGIQGVTGGICHTSEKRSLD